MFYAIDYENGCQDSNFNAVADPVLTIDIYQNDLSEHTQSLDSLFSDSVSSEQSGDGFSLCKVARTYSVGVSLNTLATAKVD